MRIGIISNSDIFLPLAGTLSANGQEVYLFFAYSNDDFTNQKVNHAVKSNRIRATYSDKNNLEHWFQESRLDACFILGYNKLISNNIIQKFGESLFNIHFGPLPEFRGPSPLFWQLKVGREKLGMAIHRLTDKFDDGPIVWKKEILNQDFFNYKYVEQLFSNICIEGVGLILSLVNHKHPILELSSKQIPFYDPKPKLNDIIIKWDTMSAKEICDLVKACIPWNKGASTLYKGTEVKLMDARLTSETTNEPPGSIISIDSMLKIACIDSRVISTSMLFVMDTFLPSYHLHHVGFKSNEKFENTFYESAASSCRSES
jgi:Methionyl-tRNA formyltransferase